MLTDKTTPKYDHRYQWTIALALLAILLAGAAFRFYNVNWDKDTYHIHPDERHTTMVITRIRWPESLGEYFDTSHSPLNPRNADMVYFYGTLPLFLTKFVATAVSASGQAGSGTTSFSNFVLFILAMWLLGLAVGFLLRVLRKAGRQWGWSWGVVVGLFVLSLLAGSWLAAVRYAESQGGLTGYDQIHLVGRVLSGLFDLGTVLLTFFLARRLFDGRVGLAASFLLAFTVLNIQGSHYFAVDTFLTFFVTLTMWFTLDVAEGKGWPGFVGLGLSMGLTMACKVSVFLLVAVVALGAWIGLRRRLARGHGPARAMTLSFLGLGLAVLLAFGVFRVAQPYAWAGPHYDGWDSVPAPWGERFKVFQRVPESIRAVVMPNPQWIADIIEAGAQQTGEADLPWGRQWTERAPWLWPLENMVKWTLGLPLGLAAWLGVGLAVVQLIRIWRRRHRKLGNWGIGNWSLVILPLAWVLLTFFWQGMQYVKSVRYFMPIHPFLATFAAFLVVAAWDWARARQRWVQIAVAAPASFVLLGTLAWAVAFIQIYTEPITRVQASRWIYENIPPGSVLANEHFDDPLPFNLDGHAAFGSGMYHSLNVHEPGNSERIDQLPLYNEDTPEKLNLLLDALDQADYIIMSSGRLWQSIPRLPMRYPMTTRYYQLLFTEELGFTKAAEFHSYPRLFGIEFDDTWAEEQFTVYDHPKVLIYQKTDAYDRERARALLSADIDWDSIPHWLNPRDVPKWKREQAQGQRVQETKNSLMLTETQRLVQEQGGTWASLFNRNSLPNRWPTLTWLILVGVVGLATLPLTLAVLHRLPDRGYILARPLGVLLLAWLSWILTNLTPLHYTRGTILLALALIASCSLASLLLPGQRRRLLDLWRNQKRMILVNEALFLAFFALLWLIRWGNPDLWHAYRGGEKPMDFAYLNAVIKSTEFPPYDPWFAGGYLNYYYFGQVMVGTLIKLIGIVPNVAYNLVVPTWFAMTAMGAFSVTYNLVAAGRVANTPYRWGLVGALFVAVLGNLGEVHLILLKLGEGIMETFQSTIPGLAALVRVIIGAFEVMFGGRALPIGLQEWYWNATRAIPPGEAYGITEFPFFTFLLADLHAHLIAMPLTFVSLAIALAVVQNGGIGYRVSGSREQGAGGLLPPASCLLPLASCLLPLASCLLPLVTWGLVIGAMRTTNTWDVPPHLLVALGALVMAKLAERGRLTGSSRAWKPALLLKALLSVAWQFGLLFLLAWTVLYRPFWESYASFYNSVALWSGPRTPLWSYLVVHGLFLFGIVSYLVARLFGGQGWQRPDPLWRRVKLTIRYRHSRDRLRRVARSLHVRGLPLSRWLWVGLVAFVLLELFFLVPGIIPFTQPKAGTIYGDGPAYRGLSVLALGLPIAILGLLLLFRPRVSPGERLWAYLALLALAMTMGVEVLVVQGDVERMNTVFKFYIQVWLFWGVAAAAALAWLAPRLRQWRAGRGWWLGGLALLVACAALYPPLATSAKVRDRFDAGLGPGLDGWVYMQTAHYYDPNNAEYDLKWDLAAMRWLLDNVVGSPVILEGHAPEYRWGARYSINTGLPTVLGWNWHQRQQRAAANDQEVWVRAGDIATMYSTPIVEVAESLLQAYRVRYIVVGPLERAYYDALGLKKFDRMVLAGKLQVVYSNQEVTIYQVLQN